MELLKLKFPRYNGNETQNEHIIYTYLSSVFKEKGYLLKVKKTNFTNVDDNIISKKGKGKASCDAYVFSENEGTKLIALIELESTGKLQEKGSGIDQVRGYANSLKDAIKAEKYKSDFTDIYLIGFDGVKLWVSQYNLVTGNEVRIIGEQRNGKEDGVEVTENEKDRFFALFPSKEKIELAEKSLIRRTKQILRGDKNLQGNRAFMLTVLASIYGNTMKEDFQSALNTLKSLSRAGKKDSATILEKWNLISVKIGYEDDEENTEIKAKIIKLYEQVAKKLFIISQDKQIDLYGYIYEELAEKSNKKEDGEYYTPRAHIKAILNSVFNRYLFEKWGLNNDRDESIDKVLSKRITDPFCGSGGFLYIFLKILKEKYNLVEDDLNDISKNSIWGMDKNDITSAYFNLFLIGDGEATLKRISTSINWENAWKYTVKSTGNKDNVKVVKIESDKELENNIQSFRLTFLTMLENLIDMEIIKKEFSISTKYNRVNNITEFIEKFESVSKQKNKNYLLFDELMKKEYKENSKPILRLIYDTFKRVSNNPTNVISYSEFIDSLGVVDFLPTNVPYGPLDDSRFKGDIGDRLESQALIECIDLLRPSTSRIDDDNGGYISNNDGGVATIVIPSGVFEREDTELREYLFNRCKILSIIKLPLHTFSPYAAIQTYVITIRKKAVFEFANELQPQDVFMYILDNDGKSNSDKRYITNIINKERTQILDNKNKYLTSVYEYTHNEIEINLEQYPEGFLSKLERTWIHGNKDKTVNKGWNQIRYSQKWDGDEWKKEAGEKWKFTKLKKKKLEKQISKNKKNIIEIIKKFIKQDDEFVNLDIVTQKEYIINELRRQYLNTIKSIELKDENITILSKKGTRIMNVSLRKYCNDLLTNTTKKIISSDDELAEFIDTIIDENIDIYPSQEKKDEEYILSEIDNILINSESDIKLLKSVQYEEYDLVIDNYLVPNSQITKDEIIENVKRLKKMQNEPHYNIVEKENEIIRIVKEIELINTNNVVKLEDIIKNNIERGDRLTEPEIYSGYGDIPVYSSTVTGPYGYYRTFNTEIDSSTIIYTIEGSNAGFVLIPVKEKIFLTDVAGIINIKDEYIKTYGKMAIAIYLQHLFIQNRHNTGKQPKFLVKRNMKMEINLDILKKISEVIK